MDTVTLKLYEFCNENIQPFSPVSLFCRELKISFAVQCNTNSTVLNASGLVHLLEYKVQSLSWSVIVMTHFCLLNPYYISVDWESI